MGEASATPPDPPYEAICGLLGRQSAREHAGQVAVTEAIAQHRIHPAEQIQRVPAVIQQHRITDPFGTVLFLLIDLFRKQAIELPPLNLLQVLAGAQPLLAEQRIKLRLLKSCRWWGLPSRVGVIGTEAMTLPASTSNRA
jgi:hypothetical protein